MRIACLVACLGLFLPGCMLVGNNRPITFASDPPGASVLIDGRDSGFVTPCVLDLEEDPTRIDLDLAGYRRETRFLTPDHQIYSILWHEMYVQPNVWRFPLWLNLQDTFVPVKHFYTLSPGRVFVRLDRQADEKRAVEDAPKERVDASAPVPATRR